MVGKSGKTYTTSQEAEADLRAKLATAKLPTEPADRPDFVPSSYSTSGRNYTIIFHDGGYGYWRDDGFWNPLPAEAYIIRAAHLAAYGYQPSVVISGGSVIILVAVFLVVGIVIAIIIYRIVQ